MKGYLTTRFDDGLGLNREYLHAMTWNTPGHFVRYAQFFEELQQPGDAGNGGEVSSAVVSRVIIWMCACTKPARNGIEVDRARDLQPSLSSRS